MTREELDAVAKIEAEIDGNLRGNPGAAAGVKWLCALVRRLDPSEPVRDDRDVVMQAQAARIVELETHLQLTPDKVFALEREKLAPGAAKKPSKPRKRRAKASKTG